MITVTAVILGGRRYFFYHTHSLTTLFLSFTFHDSAKYEGKVSLVFLC